MALLVIATLPLLAVSDDDVNVMDDTPSLVSQLEGIMVHLCRTVPRHIVNRDPAWRKRLAEHIVEASKDFEIDPYLMTVIMFCESSFKMSAVGKLGEVGLGQVHGLAAKGCDLETERGQVRCTARWLSYARSFSMGLTNKWSLDTLRGGLVIRRQIAGSSVSSTTAFGFVVG